MRPDTHPLLTTAAARRLSFCFRRYAVTSTYAPEQPGQDRPDPAHEALFRAAGPPCWLVVYLVVYQYTRTHARCSPPRSVGLWVGHYDRAVRDRPARPCRTDAEQYLQTAMYPRLRAAGVQFTAEVVGRGGLTL